MMEQQQEERSTPDAEVADGFSRLLALRGTSNQDEGDSSMNEPAKGAGSRSRNPKTEPSTAVVPVERTWMPEIVTMNGEDVAYLVNELLRLGIDVTTDAAHRGVEHLHPSMAFVRVDVAKRASELAAFLLDRTRRMAASQTSEVPIVPGDLMRDLE